MHPKIVLTVLVAFNFRIKNCQFERLLKDMKMTVEEWAKITLHWKYTQFWNYNKPIKEQLMVIYQGPVSD